MKIWPALMAGLMLACLVQAGRGEEKAPNSSFKDRVGDEDGSGDKLSRLEEGLVLAKSEADFFHQQWADLKLKNEVLGLEALTGDQKALEEKVLRLAGELYRSEKSRMAATKAIEKLIEAGRELNQAGPLERAQKRAEYEVAVREARTVAAGGDADAIRIAPDKTAGFITLFDGGLQMAVVNFGDAQGAVPGMPYRILRDGKVIGRCKLVEVRQYLSAALVEGVVGKEQVKPGDRVLLETTK